MKFEVPALKRGALMMIGPLQNGRESLLVSQQQLRRLYCGQVAPARRVEAWTPARVPPADHQMHASSLHRIEPAIAAPLPSAMMCFAQHEELERLRLQLQMPTYDQTLV